MLLDLRVAEEVSFGTRGNYEVVVIYRTTGGVNASRHGIDVVYAQHSEVEILFPLKGLTEGPDDAWSFQARGGHLIQKGNEGVKILPIEEDKLVVGRVQLLDEMETGEPAADDNDAGLFTGGDIELVHGWMDKTVEWLRL